MADENASEAKDSLNRFLKSSFCYNNILYSKRSLRLKKQKRAKLAWRLVCCAVVAFVDFDEDKRTLALSHSSCFS